MRGVVVVAMVAVAVAACGGAAPLTPDEIVPAFIAATQSESRTMHMDWQGSLTQPQTPPGVPGPDPASLNVTLNGVFDFNGPDYAGTTESGFGGNSMGQTNYARVSGVAYIDFAGGGWQNASTFGQPPTEFDPTYGLTPSDVTYEAADSLNGQAVHRLRVVDPIAVVSRGLFGSGMFGQGAPEISEGGKSDYLIYVNANGIPVAAHMSLDLAFTMPATDVAGAEASYQMVFDYTFTLWGEPVTISPPQISGPQPLGGQPVE